LDNLSKETYVLSNGNHLGWMASLQINVREY